MIILIIFLLFCSLCVFAVVRVIFLVGSFDLDGSILEHLMTLILLFLYLSIGAGEWFFIEIRMSECFLARKSFVWIETKKPFKELNGNISDLRAQVSEVTCY